MLSPVQKISVHSADADAVARPKVLRRPAQFSGPVAPNALSNTPQITAVVATAESIPGTPLPARPWQEDGRFGLALVAIIVLINLGLLLWLPSMLHAPNNSHETRMPVVMMGTLNPAPNSLPVTLYSQPARETVAPSPPVHELGDAPVIAFPAAAR